MLFDNAKAQQENRGQKRVDGTKTAALWQLYVQSQSIVCDLEEGSGQIVNYKHAVLPQPLYIYQVTSTIGILLTLPCLLPELQ